MPKGRVIRLSSIRIIREAGWSMVISGVIVSGLIVWILIPSVALSLETGLSNYSNSVGAYVVVNQSGTRCAPIFGGCALMLTTNVTDKIAAIPGVEKIYPIIVNKTTVIGTTSEVVNGKNTTFKLFEGEASALLGGPKGFPQSLVVLSTGRLPENQPEFAFSKQNGISLGSIKTVDLACQFCPHSPQSHGNITNAFNASAVGQLALNPVLVNVQILWNSTFMLNKLGPTLFRQTWQGVGSNYIIVKADSVADVPRVANATMEIIRVPQYGLFGVMYNQALSQSLQSFAAETAPLYYLVGVVSLVAVAGVTFLVSQLIARRREWEAGVYLTQGWTWSDVRILYLFYFLFLSLISFAIAAIISTLAVRYFTATYIVYGTIENFTAAIVPLYLLSGLAFAFLLAFLSSYIIVRRQKSMGLDKVVREY